MTTAQKSRPLKINACVRGSYSKRGGAHSSTHSPHREPQRPGMSLEDLDTTAQPLEGAVGVSLDHLLACERPVEPEHRRSTD